MREPASKRGFARRPGKAVDPERWIKASDMPASPSPPNDALTARLTIDVTTEMRGRIKITAFQRGMTVADMLRDLLNREFPPPPQKNHRRHAMTGAANPRARGGPVPSALPSDDLTHVELTWVEKKIEHWIRFGENVHETIIDRRRRVLSFRPATIFAYVRWASNDFGTVISRIDIVRAVSPHEPYQTLPFVRPGGDILLKIDGWPKVEKVLFLIDAIEALKIDPAEVSADHWRHVHNRLTAGHEPRAYTLEQHRAFLKRRRAEP